MTDQIKSILEKHLGYDDGEYESLTSAIIEICAWQIMECRELLLSENKIQSASLILNSKNIAE